MTKDLGRGGERSAADGTPVLPGTWSRRENGSRLKEQDAGDNLLRFLTRLARFGLAADPEPLLRPLKRGS